MSANILPFQDNADDKVMIENYVPSHADDKVIIDDNIPSEIVFRTWRKEKYTPERSPLSRSKSFRRSRAMALSPTNIRLSPTNIRAGLLRNALPRHTNITEDALLSLLSNPLYIAEPIVSLEEDKLDELDELDELVPKPKPALTKPRCRRGSFKNRNRVRGALRSP